MLELVNRARLDPVAEALRLGIDLNKDLSPGTITAGPKQPLAMDDALVLSSRNHSQWMLDADVFSHTGIGGSSAYDRMVAAGYSFTGSWTAGENISWRGTSPGPINLSTSIVNQHNDLFLSAGHRTNILSDDFREIGIGQREGLFLANGTNWSASMVTQNFARSGSEVFITGVVYNDTVNDNFYGIGEGVGGVSASAGGRTNVTGAAGGYEIGLAQGAHTLTIGGVSLGVTLGASNIKVDVVNGSEVWTNASVQINSGVASAFLIGIEAASLTGSTAAERLTGNAAANRLSGGGGDDILAGGAGADTLDGGGGTDLVTYAGSAAVQVDLLFNNAIGGDAQGDRFSGVEHLLGTSQGDGLWGDNVANRLEGDNGGDWLDGRGGADTLLGGFGDDNLMGGAGADSLDGGDGFDYARFDAATAGVQVDIQFSNGVGGDAQGDVFVSIEGISGSNLADGFWGNSGQNAFYGWSGNDYLDGRDGADWLFGGIGEDSLVGGRGADQLFGEGGSDVFLFTLTDLQAGVRDVVNDFADGADLLRFHGLTPGTFGQGQFGADVLLWVALAGGGYGEVLVRNTTLAALADQIVFG